jgi:predicted TIM-barrel fold metal-dependent hydrolase
LPTQHRIIVQPADITLSDRQIERYANTQLGHKFLFGSDFPLITPDRWLADFKAAGFRENVHEPILKGNALGLLFAEE